jgi:redox-sensitive bicupin YhaK (pirin superfamily)
MIRIRPPESIYQAHGSIENGTFAGRWHFSFDDYADPEYVHFGSLRVFNDDTLSPGAVWPLPPHRNIEVVTYCAGGEFRHADEHGQGAYLYNLEGGAATLNGLTLPPLAAAMVTGEPQLNVSAPAAAELLLVEVQLAQASSA